MNLIRDSIVREGQTFGTWVSGTRATDAENFARLGFSWAIVDLQHGSHSWESAISLLPALEHGGCAALIRVGWNDPGAIMRALDLGAIGVVVPCVSTAEEARAAARAARYPPKGVRSLGPLRASAYSTTGIEANQPLCIVMVETSLGLENADAIAAVEGVDAILLGPGDLAVDLGLPITNPPHSRIVDASRKLAAACATNGKIYAAAAFDRTTAEMFLETGAQMLAIGTDMQFMMTGAREALSWIEGWRKKPNTRPSPTERDIV